MPKGSPPPPKNPFARPDSLAVSPSPETRSAMGGMGTGIKAGGEDSGTSSPFGGRVATAGLGQGRSIAGKKLESGDAPPAKKNPFDRGKPQVETKPSAPQTGQNKPPPEVVMTSKGLEVAQVKTQNPDEFAQRVKEAQKPAAAPAAAETAEVTGENYTKAYEQKEKEKLETQKAEAQQQKIEIQKAQEATKRTVEAQNLAATEQQVQMTKNASLAHQARELQGRMVFLRSQLGGGNDESVHAAIEECRIQLAQIPSGLQG